MTGEMKLNEYLGGRLVLVQNSSKNVFIKTEWHSNPSFLANTHSGLWKTCLAVTGKLFFFTD